MSAPTPTPPATVTLPYLTPEQRAALLARRLLVTDLALIVVAAVGTGAAEVLGLADPSPRVIAAAVTALAVKTLTTLLVRYQQFVRADLAPTSPASPDA